MLPVALEFAQKAKGIQFTFDSLEILIDANPFHVVYIAVFFKMLIDIYLGFAQMDLISQVYLPAGVLISLLNVGDFLLRVAENNGSVPSTILACVDSSDYISLCTIFCTLSDFVLPILHISNPLLFPELSTVAFLLRGISCLRILRLKDVVDLLSLGRSKLASLVIEVPVSVSEAMKNVHDQVKNIVDPPKKAEEKSEKSEKKEKKEKKDKKEKKKKEKVPVDIPARSRFFLVALDLTLLALDVHDMSLIPFIPISILTPCRIISLLYIVDFTSHLMEVGGNLGAILPERIDSFSVYIVGVVYVILATLLQITGLGLLPVLNTLVSTKVMVFARLVRSFRIINVNKDLAVFLEAISGVTSLFIQQMMFAFVTVYIFAMLGNLLFGSFSEKWANPLAAYVTSQHLFLPADFVDTAEDVIGKTTVLSVFFFILFFFVSLVVCNIALSIVIEWYGDALNEDGKAAAEKEKKTIQQLFDAAKSRAHARSVVRNMGMSFDGHRQKLHLEGITCTRDQSSDNRAKLVGSLNLEKKDLAECQKYASTDLLKGYDDFKWAQESKDEASVIDSFLSADVGTVEDFNDDDVLFSAGEIATKGFLLTSGAVRVLTPSGRWFTLQPMTLLGAEVLQPDGIYSTNCKAVGETKCLVIDQKDIVENMPDELSGSLTRLAFKTKAALVRAIETDAKSKKARRRSLGFHDVKSGSGAAEELTDGLVRVSVLVADDNAELTRVTSQVLNNLGCVAKAVDFNQGALDVHLMSTKVSAAISDLHKVEKGDSSSVFVSGSITVRLPARSAATEEDNFASDPKKILIVDDVSLVRKMVSKVVNKIGFECEFAENGQIACDKFSENPSKFAGIILDLHMPVKDGTETLQTIRYEFKSEIPIFIITGDADNLSVAERVLELGANVVLHKPVEIAEVMKAFVASGLVAMTDE
jgi:CheY-like chemotaxis protein